MYKHSIISIGGHNGSCNQDTPELAPGYLD
jgi:hypothetical protein